MRRYCFCIEIYNTEHIAVVRYRNRLHIELLTTLQQLTD